MKLLLPLKVFYFILFNYYYYYFTLQYCISFATHQHESATGVHVFPIPNHPPHHPSGSSQYTSPKHPAPCIEPRLAIPFLYDIIHVLMPFSQIMPPSPSPTESTRLFSTSVSLLLPLFTFWASLVAQRLKRVPAMWETRVRSLGWEDALEKEMATHSSILA